MWEVSVHFCLPFSEKRFPFVDKLTSSSVVKHRSKPALTQAWVNDAAYFDGTGFAQITFAEESARMQRFEQEVKLLSHDGILLLLHNRVNIHPFILIVLFQPKGDLLLGLIFVLQIFD